MIRTSLRVAARILTGSAYAILGAAAVREPGRRVEQAAPLLAAVRKVVPLPENDVTVLRANGVVQVAAGAMLALGLLPRLSALAMAGSLIPTTMAGHAFWSTEDPATKTFQRTQFLKNMAMIGGLLFATLDERRK